jgi:hypothetical protein
MKFTKFLVLLILASCVLTSHLKRKVKKTDPIKHSVIAIGDIGQIDQFFEATSIGKAIDIINQIDSPEKMKRKIMEITKYTKDQKFFLYDINNKFEKDKICLHHNKPLDLTLNNFAPVLTQIEKETFDEAVVLGDAVYTEGKNLANILKGSLAIEKIEGDFTLTKMKKADVFTINELEEAKKIGDLKSLFNQYIFVEFLRRLYCAWQQVISIFDKSTKLKNPSMVFGNHSMDVKYSLEIEQISKFTPWNVDNDTDIRKIAIKNQAEGEVREKWDKIVDEMMNKPKATLVKKGGKNFILYLDFDMSKLICADYLDGEKNRKYNNQGGKVIEAVPNTEESKRKNFVRCLQTRYVNSYPQYYTDADQIAMFKVHNDYYKNLKEVLVGKEVMSSRATWKIVRVHQPIFNIERDLSGVKQNRVLMGLFKNAGIHFWMVSHHHSAQVNIARYESDNYKYKVLGDTINMRGKAKEFLDPLKIEAKADKLTVYNELDDYFFKKETVTENGEKKDKITLKAKTSTVKEIGDKAIGPEMIDRSKALLKDCLQGTNFCNIKISKEKNDYIIQLLAGNGGRMLDPLMSDLFTDSVLLFGKSRHNEFGYYKIDFEGDTAIVTFKSNGKEDFVLKITQVENADDAMNFKLGEDKKSLFESLLENKFNSAADNLKKIEEPKGDLKEESKKEVKVNNKEVFIEKLIKDPSEVSKVVAKEESKEGSKVDSKTTAANKSTKRRK